MKKCKECGVEFEPKSKKQSFCTPVCKQKDYRKRMAVLLSQARIKKQVEPAVESFKKAVGKSNLQKIEKAVAEEKATELLTLVSNYDEIISKISKLEDELKRPPPNPSIGLTVWKRVRETEIQKLKQQLK